MPRNLIVRRAARALAAAGALCCAPTAVPAQSTCPPGSGIASDSGWAAYRAGRIEQAAGWFGRAARLCPRNVDAQIGLGFTALRAGRNRSADSLFEVAIGLDSLNADAWEGLARSALRVGEPDRARRAARRAVTLAPTNAGAREILDRLEPDWNRRPVTRPRRPDSLQLAARVRGTRLEVRSGSGWAPLYLQGVNLGLALPGRFPSEFPEDSARYAGWLDTIAGMHANVVRTYTIVPPEFYRALRGWNLTHPDRPLRVLHGVWTELPEDDDFDAPEFVATFRQEMRRVVDLLHGAAEIPRRPGHAGGRYDADVSPWVVGYIIGREWEPYAVTAYNARRPGTRPYRGRYLTTKPASAMDVWMTEQCDYLLRYEADTYNALRPIAYTNWPTLDPLAHPTESSAAEERRWRGEPEPAARAGTPSHEEDVAALDAMLVRPTAANPAGWFASYHVYPYYPDFMINDPGYARARSSEGPSLYYGYLDELVRHHAGTPLVISEYGVPSSRGIAHLHPLGWHHGGHDEREMAALDARMAREIRESGAAGGVVFAWIDEWFKRSWIVAPYESPAERDPRWLNLMDAEEHYGIVGEYAGGPDRPELGGAVEPWLAGTVVARARDAAPFTPAEIRLSADPGHLYVAVPVAGAAGKPFPWDSLDLQIAIDTYGRELGQHVLPGSAIFSEVGFEFLVELRSPGDAEIRIVPDYNPYAPASSIVRGDDQGRFYRHPAAPVARDDGRFDSLFVITNRARYGRDGTFFPTKGYNRGRLLHGTPARSTIADWYYDERAGVVELRLPWGLLNVTDPSTATILFETPGGPDYAVTGTDGFRVAAAAVSKAARPVVGAAPALDGSGRWRSDVLTVWKWPGWAEAASHERLKPVHDSLRAVWGAGRE